MLTRETALARLRATGTLSSAGRSGVAITTQQAGDPLAKLVNDIASRACATTSARHLATSINQMVLP